jgi:hypothetical protein
MTEHTSFGGLAVADPRSAAQPVEPEDAGEDNRRKLAVVGAAVAVVVVLIAAFFLMKGKGGGEAPVTAPNALAHVGTTTAPAGTAAKPAKPVTLPKSFKGVIGRDPFKALYVQPADKAAGAETPSAASGVENPPTSTTTLPAGSTPPVTVTQPGSTGTTTGPTTPVNRPIWIKLTKLTATDAKFDVGFSDHKNLTVKHYTINRPTASSPEVFAGNFALLRVSAGSAMLQYGDGTPFVLDEQHPVMIVN